MANLTVIDPEGDLVITVGRTGFKVSSKILCLASPVFKALFGPSFSEGQTTPTLNHVRQIELHDDDTEALGILCELLHHKSLPTSSIGIDRLEKLAVVVDKYDCVRAMYYWAKCEILDMKDSKEPCRLLWPAYAFDEAQFFTSLTKFMVLHLPNGEDIMSASEKYGLSEEVEGNLPDGIIDTIYLAERKVKREMQVQIENLISPIAGKHTPSDFMSASDDFFLSHCDCLSIGSLVNALSRQGLWPLTSTIHRLSIAMFCKKLESCDFALPNRMTKAKRCTKCPESIASKIVKIRQKSLTKFEGLCLDCIKHPGKTEEQRKTCQVPHHNYRGLPRQLSPSETL